MVQFMDDSITAVMKLLQVRSPLRAASKESNRSDLTVTTGRVYAQLPSFSFQWASTDLARTFHTRGGVGEKTGVLLTLCRQLWRRFDEVPGLEDTDWLGLHKATLANKQSFSYFISFGGMPSSRAGGLVDGDELSWVAVHRYPLSGLADSPILC